MSASDFSILPTKFSLYSISDEEIVLPQAQALEAIDILKAKGVLILGWEGWVKDSVGRIGHGSAPLGTGSLQGLSVVEAAALCRETILQDAAQWAIDNPGTTDELHFCITVRT